MNRPLKHIFPYILALLCIQSCISKVEKNSHEPEYLNQSEHNIQTFKMYKVELKKLDSLYSNLVERYNICEGCGSDEESINQHEKTLLSLIESHDAWEASLAWQDSLILNAYYGGSMANGVLNQNRIRQIKARIQLYESLF